MRLVGFDVRRVAMNFGQKITDKFAFEVSYAVFVCHQNCSNPAQLRNEPFWGEGGREQKILYNWESETNIHRQFFFK